MILESHEEAVPGAVVWPRTEEMKDQAMGTQRISYLPLEQMDNQMRAEMERCRREGTPRPESSAVRAHVPAAFWFFANSWRDLFRDGICDHAIKELCRLYVSRTVQCEYCGNQRSVKAAETGALIEDHVKDLLNIEHHEVLGGTTASMAPGFEDSEALKATKAAAGYWASQGQFPTM